MSTNLCVLIHHILSPVTSFIRGQRIQWLVRITRRNEEETIGAIMEWILGKEKATEEGHRERGG